MSLGRTIFALCLGLVLCAGPIACNKHSDAQATTTSSTSATNTITPSADGNSQTVSNSEGFSVQVPGEWKERKADQPHVAMMMIPPHPPAPGQLSDMLIVTVVPLAHPDHPPTIEEEVKADKRVVDKNHPESQYGPVETTTIDANDARVFWLKYNLNQKPARSHRMIALHNNKCYMVLFTCDGSRGEESDQQFKQILSTWKWQ